MALTKGTNSYVTLTEADSYFEDRLDASDWQLAPQSIREQALVTATRILEEKSWEGVSVSETQALAFPRSGSFADTSRGFSIAFTNDYAFPSSNETETSLGRDIQLLRKACYELAYHLLNNEGLTDNTGTVESIKVGPIELTEIRNASTAKTIVDQYISPMVRSGNYWRPGW